MSGLPRRAGAGLLAAVATVGFAARAAPAASMTDTSVATSASSTPSGRAPAPALEPGSEPLADLPGYEVVVDESRPFSAASARTVRDRDLLLRPRTTPEDVLRVVPGLVLAQHQGGGKADQLFLRGFDADHGTDVSVNLDGVPVNLPSHAHGQGYADLHFLIPETIERVEITKGPYFADQGDFDTAGAVNLVTRRSFDASQVTAQTGLFPTLSGDRTDGTPRVFAGYRILGIAAGAQGPLTTWFAGEVFGTGGPFLNSERLERYNLTAKASYAVSPRTDLSLLFTGYSSGWIGSGQIPARLVDAGVLDRYGAVDPTEGGATQRQQAILSLTSKLEGRARFTARLSVLRYALALFNDFTFQARDPVHGDELEQDDRRTSISASLRYDRDDVIDSLGYRIAATTSLGAALRTDSIDGKLWKVERRVRLPCSGASLEACVDTSTTQSSAAAWVQEELKLASWARLILGLRSDLYIFDVQSHRQDGALEAGGAPAPGPVQRSIQSPKASLVVSPLVASGGALDLYANFGTGFHSNDARSVVETGGSGALPRAVGYELGARGRLFDGKLELAAALWRLGLASELVWSGDAGGTSPSASTLRDGLDLEGRCELLPWLFADLDLSLARSRYRTDAGNGNAVALAPPRIVTGGLTAHHPSGFKASLRVRHIGERPASQLTAEDPLDPANPGGARVPQCAPAIDATPDANGNDPRCYLVATGYTVFDLALGWESQRASVMLTVENLTNSDYREAQFGNVSQVIARPARTTGFVPETHPVADVHYTPGNPLGVQVAVGWKL